VQVCSECDLAKKYFSHSSLVIYFLANPPIKLKLDVMSSVGGGGDY
jgi:hypothetical protein